MQQLDVRKQVEQILANLEEFDRQLLQHILRESITDRFGMCSIHATSENDEQTQDALNRLSKLPIVINIHESTQLEIDAYSLSRIHRVTTVVPLIVRTWHSIFTLEDSVSPSKIVYGIDLGDWYNPHDKQWETLLPDLLH